MALPITNAIVILPGEPGDPGLGSQPFSTLGGQRIAIDPADAAPAFAAARDAMYVSGGTAWVAPGTQTYQLGSMVDWGTKPVELAFSRGARLALGPAATTGFRFQGPARLEGLEVLDNWPNSTGRTFLDLDGTASADVCSDVELVRCLFSMTATGTAVADAFCIRARGFSAAQRNGRLVLDHCAFVTRGGVQQAWSWVGEETSGAGANALTGSPYGVGFLKASNWRQVLAPGLSLRARLAAGSQYAGVLVLLDNVDGVVLDGVLASDLWTVSAGSTAPVLVLRASAGVDAAAWLGGSFAEAMDVEHVLAVTGNVLLAATGNQAGRIGGAKTRAAWRALDCEGVLFAENVAHNVSGALNPCALDIDGGRAALVLDNANTLRKNGSRSFQVDGTPLTLVRGNYSESVRD